MAGRRRNRNRKGGASTDEHPPIHLQPARILRRALDGMGLAYKIKSHAGQNRAYLRLGKAENANVLRMTAVLQNGIFKLTALQLQPCEFRSVTMLRLNELNRKWTFGCTYLNQVTGQMEASVGLYTGLSVPHPTLILVVLHHLVYAASTLRRFDAPSFILPPSANRSGNRQLQALLDSMGYNYMRAEDGGPHTFALGGSDGLDMVIQLSILTAGHLVMRAHLPSGPIYSETGPMWQMLQRVNADLEWGYVGLLRSSGRLYYQIAAPLEWTPMESSLLTAMLRSADEVLTTAQRLLPC